MHRASTHPATPPFAYPWEDTGTGYGYGPGFGHWDPVHEILDVMPTAPEHAREELLNDINLQLPSGFLPGLYWMRSQNTQVDAAVADVASAKFSPAQTHPPADQAEHALLRLPGAQPAAGDGSTMDGA